MNNRQDDILQKVVEGEKGMNQRCAVMEDCYPSRIEDTPGIIERKDPVV